MMWESTMMLASCGSNYCVLLINFREYLVEDIVQLQRQPGQREQRHHHHQHLDHLNTDKILLKGLEILLLVSQAAKPRMLFQNDN